MITILQTLYEVLLWCSNLLKIFSSSSQKPKNSSMHICNGCWAEIEDHAYITRCGHQFCASPFLFFYTSSFMPYCGHALLKFFCLSSLVLSSVVLSLLLLTHILLLNLRAFYSRKQTTGEEDIQRVLSSGECPICQKAVLERHVKQTPLVLEEEKVQVQNVFVFLLSLLCLCLLLLQNTHANNNTNK